MEMYGDTHIVTIDIVLCVSANIVYIKCDMLMHLLHVVVIMMLL